MALHKSNVSSVKLLIQAGANVSGAGPYNPLVTVAEKGLSEAIKCLLEAGANPNILDKFGRLPIELAAEYGTREDVENDGQNDSLNMARIEQKKANEEKEAALNKVLMLEEQLDKKQKLELNIEQLGKLEVVKHMEGEGVDMKKHTEELTNELDGRIDAMENVDELIQALIIKEGMANDELQDARKELIKGLADLLNPRRNIVIKRMGELDELARKGLAQMPKQRLLNFAPCGKIILAMLIGILSRWWPHVKHTRYTNWLIC